MNFFCVENVQFQNYEKKVYNKQNKLLIYYDY